MVNVNNRNGVQRNSTLKIKRIRAEVLKLEGSIPSSVAKEQGQIRPIFETTNIILI